MTPAMRSRGFTLIELLVTMTLAGILMLLAVPSFTKLLANQRLGASASELVTTAMQARSAALKHNQRVIVQPTASDGDWAKGWRIYVDIDRNSSFSSTTDTLIVTMDAMPDGITVEKLSGTNNFFGYDGSGFLASIGGSSNSTWKISSSKTERIRCLIVERSGRARIQDPYPGTSCSSS